MANSITIPAPKPLFVLADGICPTCQGRTIFHVEHIDFYIAKLELFFIGKPYCEQCVPDALEIAAIKGQAELNRSSPDKESA